MSLPEKTADTDRSLTVYCWSDEAIRSRSVSRVLSQGTLAIPQPPARLTADWDRELARLGLEIGDIEPLPLARTIMRWPDYARCAEAVSAWMQTLGLPDLLSTSEIALMACRGTPYHHDAAQYGDSVFCNLFLSEDKGMDLHFPFLGKHIPLTRGTVVIFDTAQPHAAIPRGSSGFNVANFAPNQNCTQIFLTWELSIENAQLKRALQIDFDIDAASGSESREQKVCLNGIPVTVCPDTGRWCQAD